MSPLGGYLAETLATLAGVAALAILVLYAARRAGFGRTSGPLELVGHLSLDARRAVYLVRAARMVYVLAASEAGLRKIGELAADDVPRSPERPKESFGRVLARVLGKRAGADEGDGSRDPSGPQPTERLPSGREP